jgi:hypothetical protein
MGIFQGISDSWLGSQMADQVKFFPFKQFIHIFPIF